MNKKQTNFQQVRDADEERAEVRDSHLDVTLPRVQDHHPHPHGGRIHHPDISVHPHCLGDQLQAATTLHQGREVLLVWVKDCQVKDGQMKDEG
ncbi:hypothetical protein E2C01_054217 [Portunus trituberculatus]|uniref:Uncharacterized protein n=1 Tax=Portunus trituberculatus TaxID=210409 RepID=A0A5B7GIQ9_PORTR|nr:hypothetical protein [Portunus trituberculatus]